MSHIAVRSDLLERERAYRHAGFRGICGIDEAGRGPLAGPVVAACVILPEDFDCAGIDDSKKLTPKRRDQQFDRLMAGSVRIGVGIVDAAQIDHENILRATHSAMRLALSELDRYVDIVLVDGLPVEGLSRHRQEAIVGGDAISASIAAASIVAKVTRDRLMARYDTQYPLYGFAVHKGYPTAQHVTALRRYGPCPIHRRSFAPVAEAAKELAERDIQTPDRESDRSDERAAILDLFAASRQ
jgi:ribonuclease HII